MKPLVKLLFSDTKDLMGKASAIKQQGEELRIWLPGFTPRGTVCLKEFLAEKTKTVFKKRKRTSWIEDELKTAKIDVQYIIMYLLFI